MFAEEVGDFGMSFGMTQRCVAIHILRIHIRTFGYKEFDDLLVPPISRLMQRSPSTRVLRIHFRTFVDK